MAFQPKEAVEHYDRAAVSWFCAGVEVAAGESEATIIRRFRLLVSVSFSYGEMKMKRGMQVFAAFGMAAVLVGCQGATDAQKEKPATESNEPVNDGSGDKQSSVSEETSSVFTLVSLKVPNMT